jgi:hypothetical protein
MYRLQVIKLFEKPAMKLACNERSRDMCALTALLVRSSTKVMLLRRVTKTYVMGCARVLGGQIILEDSRVTHVNRRAYAFING